MGNNVIDIAQGRARRLLGAGNSADNGEAEGGDFPIKLNLEKGQRLIGEFLSKKSVPSTYKNKDGSPQPDVLYYTFMVSEDTGLFYMTTNPETGRKAEEPIPVGAKVSLRGKGDLNDSMSEAEPGMTLEIEFLGTKTTNSGFNFSQFIVSELV